MRISASAKTVFCQFFQYPNPRHSDSDPQIVKKQQPGNEHEQVYLFGQWTQRALKIGTRNPSHVVKNQKSQSNERWSGPTPEGTSHGYINWNLNVSGRIFSLNIDFLEFMKLSRFIGEIRIGRSLGGEIFFHGPEFFTLARVLCSRSARAE